MARTPTLTEKNPLSVLNLLQRRYVEARCQGLPPTEAARAAGYEPKSAYNGSLERHPKVRAAIQWVVQQGMPKPEDISKNEVLQGMLDAVQSAATATELTNAWKEIGKLIGAYAPEKKIIQMQDATKADLRTASDAELIELAGSDYAELAYDGEETTTGKEEGDEDEALEREAQGAAHGEAGVEGEEEPQQHEEPHQQEAGQEA